MATPERPPQDADGGVPVAVASRTFSRHPVLRAELLARYTDARFNDAGASLRGESLVEFARGRRKLITALEPVDESLLAALPELEVVSKFGVGTDTLDLEAMLRHGVRLGWRGGVNRRSVSELAVAFMIALLHLVPEAYLGVREGVWRARHGHTLTGKVVGIIGCGHIGKDLVPLVRAFGCRVLAHDILSFPEFYAAHDVEPVSLEELLRRSEVVTLHVPLDGSTRGILNAERLALLRPGAVLVNTARGGLVDEGALKGLLKDGRLAGAGFDVFATEPPDDPELLRLPTFLATPHIGGSTDEAVLAMGRAAIEGLDENRLPSADYPGTRRPRAGMT